MNIYLSFIKRCKIPSLANDTYESMGKWHDDEIEKYIPSSEKNFKTNFDRCKIKSYLNKTNLLNSTKNFSSFPLTNNFILEKCDKWVYSKKYFESTLSSEVIIGNIIFKKIIFQ